MTSGAMDGPGTTVRVTPDQRRADEWAVVLAAADIPHWTRRRLDGWALIVAAEDEAGALQTLAAYDQENARELVPVAAPARPMTIVGVLVALWLIGFFAITGPRTAGSAWFEHGSADAARMLDGEWWRAVTALTLHADGPHVLGNAVAVALLLTTVCRLVGTGVGVWLVLLAGAGGNVLTAAVHRGDHVSVGASTALFGAIGILGALRIVAPHRVGAARRRTWFVIAGGLALLALLGTGPHADLLAHLFGFLAGGAVGALAALTLRRDPPVVVQGFLGILALAAVLGAWQVALQSSTWLVAG